VVVVVLVVVVVVVGAVVVVVGAVVVVVGAVVVVVPPHGFGSHVPGPRLAPLALEQALAVSRTQVKAPMGDPGKQHWISGRVVVVVVGAVVVVVPPHGFGSHVPDPRLAPPALEQALAVSRTQVKAPMGDPGKQHWISGMVVDVVVVVGPVVVVVGGAVVVVVGPHAGSVGSVQEQSPFRQFAISALRHALKAAAFKPGHAAAISSEQTFGLHSFVAVASETKPPAQSATAANVTAAFLVIVEPPMAVPMSSG
jgi:hypothetical protein